MLSKRFHLHQPQRSKTHSQHWRRCTQHGRRHQAKVVICISSQPSMREWRSLISTTNVLLSRMPISWPWVSLPSFPCTVLTRVLCCTVLNPKKKMAHFTKFWPADLVEEVESVVRESVSTLIYSFLTLLTVLRLVSSSSVTIGGSTRNNPRPHVCARQLHPPANLAAGTSTIRTCHHQTTTTTTTNKPPKVLTHI